MKKKSSTKKDPGEAAFNKSIETALKGSGQEVDLNNFFPGLSANEDDIQEARACYLEHAGLLDAAILAVNKTLESPELSSRINAFGQKLATEELYAEGEQLVKDLVETGNFAYLFSLAPPVGIKAIGIGVAGSFQLLFAGAEKGYEGIWILPDDVYGIVSPTQFTTRSWGEITVGVDVLASAGINISFWFTKPETSLITGIFIDVILPYGFRFSYIKTKPLPDSKPTAPFSPPNATFAGFSSRVSLGLEVGGGIFVGKQSVPADAHKHSDKPIPPDQVLMTIKLDNTTTNASNLMIGKEATLNTTLIAPSGGENDPCMLTKNVTKLAIAMPSNIFSPQDVSKMTVSDANWRLDASTNCTLNLTYVGNNAMWSGNLILTISNVKGTATTEQVSGVVRAMMSNNEIQWKASTNIDLVALVVNAVITSWTLELGEDFTLAPPPEGYPGTTLPVNGSNVTLSYPNDGNGWVQLTEFQVAGARNTTTFWNCGAYFSLDDDGNLLAQAVIWKDGTPWDSGTKYQSMKIKLDTDPLTCFIGYDNDYDTTLTVTAKLA